MGWRPRFTEKTRQEAEARESQVRTEWLSVSLSSRRRVVEKRARLRAVQEPERR